MNVIPEMSHAQQIQFLRFYWNMLTI